MDGQNPSDRPNNGHNEFTHDQPVSLRETASTPPPAAQPLVSEIPPQSEAPAAVPAEPAPFASLPFTPAAQPTPNTEGPAAAFLQGDEPELADSAVEGDLIPSEIELTWTASEFIAHPKTVLWYAVMSAISVLIIGVAFLISHDVVTVIVFLIAAGLFGYMASRQPRQLSYALGPDGVSVGPKYYPYAGFKAFAPIEDGAFTSIDFVPLKRFAPMLSIYCDPQYEPQVVQILSQHLPFSNHKRTVIDGLMHRIRF